MCSCDSDNPFECIGAAYRSGCSCSCHRRWKAPAHAQGPKQPLDEKEAEIARLRAKLASLEESEVVRLRIRVAVLEEVENAAGIYLTNSTPVNAVKLNDALRKAREENQGE